MPGSTECPECGSEKSSAYGSRNTTMKTGWKIRRRVRRCSDCAHSFVTFELPEFALQEIEARLDAMDALTKALEAAIPAGFRTPQKFRATEAPQTERK